MVNTWAISPPFSILSFILFPAVLIFALSRRASTKFVDCGRNAPSTRQWVPLPTHGAPSIYT
jgi:hypothetical protein